MVFDVIPINGETWVICGGRGFADTGMFNAAMGDLVRYRGVPGRIVHGACRQKELNGECEYDGADGLADKWAKRFGIDVQPEPADWDTHGKSAGPIRNQTMLNKYKPIFVVAFPGGRGTADMVAKARRAEIDVAEIQPISTAPESEA